MASLKQSFQKVLDSTVLATTKFIRRPPIDQSTPIQGKPRVPSSNAYRSHQEKEGRRLEKALNSISHGQNIYVYHNLRTKQVVYSLTRQLEKTNLLKQCVYHGKKTVPAEVRKDMWVPYYSLHFEEGQVGLNVYNLVRQFALLRQLRPPKDMITVTKEYLESKRPADPRDHKEFEDHNMGRLGQIMKKKERAQVLMNQKATSIADVAFALSRNADDIVNGRPGWTKAPYKTQKARRRYRKARDAAEALAKERGEQIKSLEEQLGAEIRSDQAAPQSNSVKILWQDLYDAQYAKKWPEFVYHNQLLWTRTHIIGQEEGADQDAITDGTFEEAK